MAVASYTARAESAQRLQYRLANAKLRWRLFAGFCSCRSECSQASIDRNSAGAAQAERDKSRKIEQVCLVARLPEMGAGGIERLQLDRAEAVREMDREYGHQQDDRQRDRHERNKRANDDQKSSDDLHENGRPAHQEGGRDTDGVQDTDEIVGTSGKFRIAVLQETKTDSQPERNGIPCRRKGEGRDRKLADAGDEVHRESFPRMFASCASSEPCVGRPADPRCHSGYRRPSEAADRPPGHHCRPA